MQVCAHWQSRTDKPMHGRSMHTQAVITLSWIYTNKLASLFPRHHSPDTRIHRYCNSRERATDVPTEVFWSLLHAGSTGTHSDGPLWQKHVDNGHTTYSQGRGPEGMGRLGGYSDDWIGGWRNGLMVNWHAVWVVREDGGGVAQIPRGAVKTRWHSSVDPWPHSGSKETHAHAHMHTCSEFW